MGVSRRLTGALAALVMTAGCTTGTREASQSPQTPSASSAVSVVPGLTLQTYPVPAGSHPHDVAPAADGGVWFTGQQAGYLGHLDPGTGQVTRVPLGDGSAPHGVIVGPDSGVWITDSGLNAIVRVDATSRAVRRFSLPANRSRVNLNTATFDDAGMLWFTGQSGVYGRLDLATGQMQVYDAPRGSGPYGITTTPSGHVYYASLAGSHIARIDTATGQATVLEPPTPGQGARRVWSDSSGRVWVSEWNAGKLAVFDPTAGSWREWPLPGQGAQAYSVYVDDRDHVWVSDFATNTLVRFEPATERFTSVALPGRNAAVRQMLGRPGELWGAASSLDLLVVVRSNG